MASYVLWAGAGKAGPEELLELLDELLLLLPLVALTGAEMCVTESINAAINAKAVRVAKTISAGDPRQNPLPVRTGVGADVKYVEDGAGAVAGAVGVGCAVCASAGGGTTAGSTADWFASLVGSATTGSTAAGCGIASDDGVGRSTLC